MARYNIAQTTTRTRTPLTGATAADATNFYRAPGYSREPKSELFLLAVSNMSKTMYYESELTRDTRFIDLVTRVATDDPDWICRFLVWLRTTANMRTASLVGAIEACRVLAKASGHAQAARDVVAGVLIRADEPGEAVAYWRSRHGRTMPRSLKRGIAEAVRRLYTQRNFCKYDSRVHGYRFADVLKLVHPTPVDDEQATLFRYMVKLRRDRKAAVPLSLGMIRRNKAVRQLTRHQWQLSLIDNTDRAQWMRDAAMDWEDVLSLAGEAGIDGREAWEAIIPTMGAMALTRNLRNFDRAGVSDTTASYVADKIANPHDVKRSRQLPFRYYSAYVNTGSDRWKWALTKALNVATSNIPAFEGRTLVLVDQSWSMFDENWYTKVSHDLAKRWPGVKIGHLAALFGTTIALRADDASLWAFGGAVTPIVFNRGDSVLATMEKFQPMDYTDIRLAIQETYRGHDRVVIVTDEQATQGDWTSTGWGPASYDAAGRVVRTKLKSIDDIVDAKVPIYVWNLAGYGVGYLPAVANRYVFGGLSDAAFGMIDALESGRDADWPF